MAMDSKILEQIRTNDPNLTSLNLSNGNIDTNDVIALAGALKNNHTLISLDLRKSSAGNIGTAALADALKGNRTLTTLYLWRSDISENGATALADALKDNRTLTELNLEYNSIGDAGAISLAGALKDNSALAILNLGYNFIDDAGITALADALITSKNIVYVYPNTEKLRSHYNKNTVIARNLIEKIQKDPTGLGLTRDDRKEIQERIPAILYVGRVDFKLSYEKTLEMLADIGIKPTPGPVTQRVNETREAQRKAALQDPSQGI